MPETNPALAPIVIPDPGATAQPAAGEAGGAPVVTPAAAAPTGPAEGEAKPAAGLIPKPGAAGGEKPAGDAVTTDPAEKPSEASGLAEGFGSKKPEPKEGAKDPKADAPGEGAKGDPAPVAVTLPAGTVVPDQAAMQAFEKFAGEMTTVPLTSEQASELAQWQIAQAAEAATAGRADWVKTAQATNQTWEKQLLDDPNIGGGDPKQYAEATAVAQKGFRRFAGEGVAQYLIDLSGGQKDWDAGESVNLTLQPDLFKMFHELGTALGEGKSIDVGGAGGGKPSQSQTLASIYNHSSSRQASDRLAKKG